MTLNLIQGKQINVTLTGSFSGSFTGNLIGSASFATSASFSSVATSASAAISSSFAVSSINASQAVSASHTLTASYVNPLYQNVSISGSVSQGSSNRASGRFSFAQGISNIANSTGSHAEGFGTVATASAGGFGYNHAEGGGTTARGDYSHAEGQGTLSTGQASHAEGLNSIASGLGSHAEGLNGQAIGNVSHVEGSDNIASGEVSHAEGVRTVASGTYSHTEGEDTLTLGQSSHAEGRYTTASGDYSHAEGLGWYVGSDLTINTTQDEYYLGGDNLFVGGVAQPGSTTTELLFPGDQTTVESFPITVTYGFGSIGINYDYYEKPVITNITYDINTDTSTVFITGLPETYQDIVGKTANIASGLGSHVEGVGTLASGRASHAEGTVTMASGTGSHAEGYFNKAVADYSHAEGSVTIASGSYSHAEGLSTQAIGIGSHTEGQNTVTSGSYSHAEGIYTVTSGSYSHAEGEGTITIGNSSHAEGDSTKAIGDSSHAEGASSVAIGVASHAEGLWTVASGAFQHTQGQFNLSSSAQSAFIIGNGTSNANRSNLVFASGSTFQVTGSVVATQGFTGSLFGTASFAVSASWAPSQIVNTGSFVTNSQTSSMTVLSASFADITGSLGYKPENISNKENTTLDNSSVRYPTNNLVKTSIDGIKQLTDLQVRRGGYVFFDDFLINTTTYPFIRSFLASGTGGLTSLSNGVYRINTTTNINSGGNVLFAASGLIQPVGLTDELQYDAFLSFPNLFTTSTTRLGFIGGTVNQADAPNGMYFETSGSSVVGKNANTSVRSSTASYTLTSSTYYHFRITYTSTSVLYEIYDSTGTQLWSATLTTNIPTVTLNCGLITTDSSTTAGTLVDLDYIGMTIPPLVRGATT